MLEDYGTSIKGMGDSIARQVTEELGYKDLHCALLSNDGMITIVDSSDDEVTPPIRGGTQKELCIAIAAWREARGLEAF